ncbi:MAG TPA: class I SAM-dependent methyltransferase [Rhizomicrobium sp.]|jgi:SAM-dependent methyltransferase|nr:class I SAM-dependent methyltransferase [Rhizomicrobium sp.]
MSDEAWRRGMTGNAFDDPDVARCYAHRPPYAPALFDFLLALVPQRRVLADLGCGPGKIAAALAERFAHVIAVDPSGPMIETARGLVGHPNIVWRHARAEDADLGAHIDLVTIGSAVHWMAHDVLFPRLADRASLIAIIGGDGADAPPWQDGWRDAMTRWLARIGLTYDEKAFTADGRRYEAWLDIAGRRSFTHTVRQRAADFIAAQHARATWTRARMGDALARDFDRDLETLLRPWSEDGMLTYDVTSELTWGAPRRTAHR